MDESDIGKLLNIATSVKNIHDAQEAYGNTKIICGECKNHFKMDMN